MPTKRASGDIVWPTALDRCEGVRKVYLDLNHWIGLARYNKGFSTLDGYEELLSSARSAVADGSTVFPLSGVHYMEMSGIKDPRQRLDLALVMQELSGFAVSLGRSTIMSLETEAGLDRLTGPSSQPFARVPLLGSSAGWACGVRGGLRIGGADGQDHTDEFRTAYGDLYKRMSRDFELHALTGPTDAQADYLRATSIWDPTVAQAHAQRRAQQEREQAARLDKDETWRRGRLRDVMGAWEMTVEVIDGLTEQLIQRSTTVAAAMGERQRIRDFTDGMPTTRMAVGMKTQYHQDGQHRWTANDIHDIDALSVAVPYFDAVLTDQAARQAITVQHLDHDFDTYVPRTAKQLAEWLVATS